MPLFSLPKFHEWRAALRFAVARLRDERLAEVAGSLTFTTVLAIVPLLTVALALFTAFPLFAQLRVNLQEYFIRTLMPPSISEGVMTALNTFASKAARISTIGAVFLFVTSMSLLLTIDNAFNRIWRVQRVRPVLQRVVLYWAAITVGPLLIGASITLTTLIASKAERMGWTLDVLFSSAPFAIGVLGFSLLYVALPSRPVRRADAVAGALVAAVFFEFAKRLFAVFIAKVPTYTTVYGAFASVPIFLLWVYLCWLITLFGATVTATIPALRYERWNRAPLSGDAFTDALAVLGILMRARFPDTGEHAGVTARDIRDGTELGVSDAEGLLDRMRALGWVARLADSAPRAPVSSAAGAGTSRNDMFDRWALIVDPATIRVSDVFRAFALEAAQRTNAPAVLARAGRALDAALDESLVEYFAR